ncbi:MAG TPA: aminotransferase V [Erysipelotrichaceae bacterium]|nr:aminotransferase V [Erysipelotrichaceae bacterium]
MIYLDYAATTPIDPSVLNVWVRTEQEQFANANSSHILGQRAWTFLQTQLSQMAELLHVQKDNLILCSSATEANNTILKGLALKYPHKKHIITSMIEHASLIGAVSALEAQGYDVDFVETTNDGLFDLNHLKSLLREDTLLVSLIAVNSETGILQPLDAIASLCRNAKIFFHSDVTQAMGKVPIDLNTLDFASCSAHKIYGPKGIGLLYRREDLSFIPLLHGGHSLSPYRSSTPQTALIAAFVRALELSMIHQKERFDKISKLKTYLIDKLNAMPRVRINSNAYSLPHIVNISILKTRPDKGIDYFSSYDICLSSKSACCGQDEYSASVYAITKDMERAQSSYRISLSHLTTLDELDALVEAIERMPYED